MEQDLERSEGNLVQPPDLSQEITDDPLPSIIEQINRFRSKIPEACQELFDKVKDSYQESFIEFHTLGKEVSPAEIQVKYIANLYLKERVVGQLYIPHLEFDDDINEKFSNSVGANLCASLNTSDDEGQKALDNFRQQAEYSMAACYYFPQVTKIAKGFEKEIIQMFLLEEIIMKEGADLGALMEPQTKFLYSGNFKQKSGSLMDHRYISCFVHIDVEAESTSLVRIKGILIVLIDKSVVEMKAAAIKEQLKQSNQQNIKPSHQRYTHTAGYLDRMKKYKNLYQGAPRYDEKVLHQLFLRLDIDGDGRIGKDDLWNFCQKNKVIIKKEVIKKFISGNR
jgi:hypothetical protein